MSARIPGLMVLAFTSNVLAQAPPSSPQQLFEAGRYEQVVQAVVAGHSREQVDPAATYLAAQSFLKLDQPDNAKSELTRLLHFDEDAWKLVGQSSMALIDGDVGGALEAANQAVASGPDAFFAHYQFGLVKAERQDWPGAAEAFERASQIDPTFAYAHYYAGLAYSKIRRIDRTAAHFETFLKLAPKAPERPAVESIMRTLRGR